MCLKDEARTLRVPRRDPRRRASRGRRRRRRRRQRDPVVLRGRGGRRARSTPSRSTRSPRRRSVAASRSTRDRRPRPRRRGRRGGRRAAARRRRRRGGDHRDRPARRAAGARCSTRCAGAGVITERTRLHPGDVRDHAPARRRRPPLLRIRDRGAEARVAVLRVGPGLASDRGDGGSSDVVSGHSVDFAAGFVDEEVAGEIDLDARPDEGVNAVRLAGRIGLSAHHALGPTHAVNGDKILPIRELCRASRVPPSAGATGWAPDSAPSS